VWDDISVGLNTFRWLNGAARQFKPALGPIKEVKISLSTGGKEFKENNV